MPTLDSGTERLSPELPRRFLVGLRLRPAMLVLAAASLAVAAEPGVACLDDHTFQVNGREAIVCNAGNTLSASSEVFTDVVAYWNTTTAVGQVVAVDGAEALTSVGASAPTDAEIGAAIPDRAFPWVRVGRTKFSRDAGTVITIEQIDHGVRPYEITTAPKATGLASSSHENDPIGDAELYEFAGFLEFDVDAADLANGDVLTDIPLPLFYGKIGRTRALVTKAVTTGAKAADLDFHIGAAAITGGQVALAGVYALGTVQLGAAVTAADIFKPGDVFSVVASGVVAFIEGRVKIQVELYKLIT